MQWGKGYHFYNRCNNWQQVFFLSGMRLRINL